MALRRALQEGEPWPCAAEIAAEGEAHPMTGGLLAGPAAVHVVHAWDSDFVDLVSSLSRDCQGDLDELYHIDLFSAEAASSAAAAVAKSKGECYRSAPVPFGEEPTPSACSRMELREPEEDSVSITKAAVAGAKEVLLVLDAEGRALQRLWVIFELLLAVSQGKRLRVRCSSNGGAGPGGGFGTSEEAIKRWEARVDAVDWSLSEVSKKSHERRLRGFAERFWEGGLALSTGGVEQLLARLKIRLRQELYSQVFLGAVEVGDKAAVLSALDRGISPMQRDSSGNMPEDVAAFYGHEDIEDLLFARRVGSLAHPPLSSFFGKKELALASETGLVEPALYKPFLTQDSEGWDLAEGPGSPGADSRSSSRSSTSRNWDLLATGPSRIAAVPQPFESPASSLSDEDFSPPPRPVKSGLDGLKWTLQPKALSLVQ